MKRTMRDVFIEKILARMEEDPRIFFLSADFGSPKLDLLRSRFGDRFRNVGIAEQNLINVAAGLAIEGFVVYAYAIAPFLTMRAFEQIRNNVALLSHSWSLNINILGVGAGLSYDVSGPTHHCLEDVSIINTLPGIDIYSPSDWRLAQGLFDISVADAKPKYFRFDGKPVDEIFAPAEFDYADGFIERARGSGLLIISTGNLTHAALKAVNRLSDHGIKVGLIDIFRIRPLNDDKLLNIIKGYENIFVYEEGFVQKAGLDCQILNLITRHDLSKKFKSFGFFEKYIFDMGSRDYLHALNDLDENGIFMASKAVMAG